MELFELYPFPESGFWYQLGFIQSKEDFSSESFRYPLFFLIQSFHLFIWKSLFFWMFTVLDPKVLVFIAFFDNFSACLVALISMWFSRPIIVFLRARMAVDLFNFDFFFLNRKNSNKMSSLRNAIPRKAHKERAQPWVMFCFPVLAILIFVVICCCCWFDFWMPVKQGRNLGCLRNIKTMLHVLKLFTKKRKLWGLDLI